MVISVITPSYNQAIFIERTIKSVLDQSGDFSIEYFIADGGSTDNTVQILKDYESQVKEGVYPIRCQGVKFRWVSEKDSGQTDAVNKGIADTTGEIIAWINSDDIYYPGAFSTVTTFFRDNPFSLIAYGQSDHIDEQDRVIGPYPTEAWDYNRLFETCYLCQPGVFFRRELVNKHGPVDADLQFCMDYELWLRYGSFTDFHYLEKPLAGSRFYENTKTLGQAVPVHSEMNDMFKKKFGHVPRRWIYAFARTMAQDLGKTAGSKKGDLDLVREVAQDAFLKWWGHIPANELEYMDMYLSHPKTNSWQVKKRLQGLDQLRIGLELGFSFRETPGLEKFGTMIACALAENDPDHQFLIYDCSTPNVDEKELDKEFSNLGLKNVHLISTLRIACQPYDTYDSNTNNLMATLGYPDIWHTDNFNLIDAPNVKIVFSIIDASFDDSNGTQNQEIESFYRSIDGMVSRVDMVTVSTDIERNNFFEKYPDFPYNRIKILSFQSSSDKFDEIAEKLLAIYKEVSILPKRLGSLDEVVTARLQSDFRDLVHRTQKKTSVTNQTVAWFIRLAEKNATIKNRLKKVGFLKKLVKFARPRFARKFPDWV